MEPKLKSCITLQVQLEHIARRVESVLNKVWTSNENQVLK